MKILLIDDNKEITEMVSFFLDSSDISCKVVHDGREAMERIRNDKYDAILLDLTLQEFSGYDIFNSLKKDDLLKNNNIILFTASYISDEDIQKIISDGAKGIIKKPTSIDDILEVLEKYR